MISISAHITSAAGVIAYHAEHYATGDYYQQDGEIAGQWFGRGAAALGLIGDIKREDFAKLANNRKPNGEKLTTRQNKERRVAQDYTIAPPKSVSIAALVDGDGRVVAAHRAAVAAVASELEKFAAVRIRDRNHKDCGKDKNTGNIVAAAFEHNTSRAAASDQRPDPQLHTHLVVFNATQDGEDDYKALQNYDILHAQKLLNAVYEHELAKRLKDAGYELRSRDNSFEIASISKQEIDIFSKRHAAIQKKVAELKANGATRNEKVLANSVAHDGRIRKNTNDSAATLREFWVEELSRVRAKRSNEKVEKIDRKVSAKDAVEFARMHIFERAAVASYSDFLAFALQNARGSDFSLEELKMAVVEDPEILMSKNGKQITTQTILHNEGKCIELVVRFPRLESS